MTDQKAPKTLLSIAKFKEMVSERLVIFYIAS
jgi:hypothetical protein